MTIATYQSYLLSAVQLVLSQPAPSQAPVDGVDPAAFFAFLMLGAVFIMLLGIGVALGISIVLLVIAGLSFGLLSASVLVGYLDKSVVAGLRTFVLATLSLLGIPAGILLLTVVQSVQKQAFGFQEIILGSIVGGIGGFVIGLLFLRIIVHLKTNIEVWYRLH